jgi:hypothetical protein
MIARKDKEPVVWVEEDQRHVVTVKCFGDYAVVSYLEGTILIWDLKQMIVID